MFPDLKVLIVGFGSVGRRHLRNLRRLGCPDENIVICHTGHSTLPEDDLSGITVERSLEAAFQHHPQATLIANPTSLHLAAARAAAQAGSHLFIEKPVAHTLDGVHELQRLIDQNKLIASVGFQFRFHPGLQCISRWLSENRVGRITSVQAHWAEYLPDWHPWEDYRQSYSARADLGGGVVLTLSHPLDYLRWLIGEVQTVYASLGYGALDIEAEDSADIQLGFAAGGMGCVHLDYVQRPPGHWLHLTGTEGSIRWDNADGIAHCYQAKTQAWASVEPPAGFERNTLFIAELEHFFACVRSGEQPICNFRDGVRVLEIALAAKEAARQGKMLPV